MIQQGQVLRGSLFSAPMRVETIRQAGSETWVLGLVGLQSERFRSVTLSAQDLKGLQVSAAAYGYAGDAGLLRPGPRAYAFGILYEFDPCFGLPPSRVDPLSHQLDAL
ncbi:MAG: hypothetical protein HY712_02380 [candidate division NC10 bacterium]|nr:hypothetical protein [candidate division NC10 bacterium]